MRAALTEHDEIVQRVVAEYGGAIIRHTGDGFNTVFASASEALRAAVDIQRELQSHQWSGLSEVRTRIGLHCGEMSPDGDDYYGSTINRAARVCDVANGDQIAISSAVVAATATDIDPNITLENRGSVRLKGIGDEHIHLVSAPGMVRDERPLRARTTLVGSMLPADNVRLIGRDQDRRDVTALLIEQRLVSLTGLGGLGKTALAVGTARAIASQFSDGVAYCELANVGADGDVAETVAQALNAKSQPNMTLTESIASYAEGRNVLVVLDNCEHVLPRASRVVQALMSVPGPHILCTSRTPLGLRGEQVFGVEPLSSKEAARELFVTRVHERDPKFVASPTDLESIDALCTDLDRIPLAIELAAARVRVMSISDLRQGLTNRFALLADRAPSSRLPTLQTVVSWSFDQLAADPAGLLDQLAVFSGGFTIEAATAVYRDANGERVDAVEMLDLMMVLVDTSLVQTERGTGELRFSMLETIRAYSLERLTNEAEVSARHAEHFTGLAQSIDDSLLSADEATIWGRVEREWPNFRAAHQHLFEAGQFDDAADLIIGLRWFAMFSLRLELFSWVTPLLTTQHVKRRAELWGLHAFGLYLASGDEAYAAALTSLELDSSDPGGFARITLASIGLNVTFDTDLSGGATAEMIERTTDVTSTTFFVAIALRTFHLCLRAADPAAIEMAGRALTLANETESATAMSLANWAWGLSHLKIDDAIPMQAFSDGLAYAQTLSEGHLIAHLINGLVCHVMSLTGDLDDAIEWCQRSVSSALNMHYLIGASHLLAATAVTLARAGLDLDAVQLLRSMMTNGHHPRRDIRMFMDSACPGWDHLDASSGPSLTIHQAGSVALGALERAKGRSTAELT
jgi:predicted ATPase